MKKFLAVFDGYKISKSTLEYAIQLTKSADKHLVGIFSGEFIYQNHSLYEARTTHKGYEKVLKELNEQNAKKAEDGAIEFQTACENAGIRFSIHKDKNIAISELKKESMYADLIVINKNETFTRLKEQPPTPFMKDLLVDVQCPVLVVPSIFKPIEKIIMLYDGAPTSVYAIKMFSYVLGNPANLPVKIFTVKDQKKSAFYVPENKPMREFIKRHFPKATFTVTRGNAELEIIRYMKHLPKNELVVLGAYQRSEVSRWFKTSMADKLMCELEMPLFIAHNK